MKEEILRILQAHSFDTDDRIVVDSEDFDSIIENVSILFASQDKWISGEVPKDGTKIIRWHRIWKIPQCVFYNENLSKTHSCNWITGDKSQSYPEDAYLPDLYQPLPKAPNTK